VLGNSSHQGKRRFEGELSSRGDLLNLRVLQSVNLFRGQNALAQKARPHSHQRIAQLVGLALGLGAVPLVVVGERVGVGAHAVAVHKSRPQAGTAVRHRGLKGQQASLRIGAVHLGKVEVREVGHEL
jgi:hypothetical protein